MSRSDVLPIPFISEHANNDSVALRDASDSLSYRQLNMAVQERASSWQQIMPDVSATARPVVMLILDNSITSVVDYLTALALDYVTLLLHPDSSVEVRESYAEKLNPNAVIGDGTVTLLHRQLPDTDPRVSILLSTSGSTGAGKCVALSNANLLANSESILAYLPVRSTDNTLATLPLSYSYGLSVLNTHLQAGACISFTAYSVFDKAFWALIKSLPVHSIAGVPSFYDMLLRLRFTRMELPELRYFTQAGGKLSEENVKQLAEYAIATQKQFFVMYGQTEATARMAFLPADKVLTKPYSIGQAIPGGEFCLRDLQHNLITECDVPGELYYRGANVMLGYVADVSDLASFSPHEWLATGDLARFDAQHDFIITGRTKRIIKMTGERVNLDEVEQLFHQALSAQALTAVACVIGQDNQLILLYSEGLTDSQKQALLPGLCTRLKVNPRFVLLEDNAQLSLLSNGKLDYTTLKNRYLADKRADEASHV